MRINHLFFQVLIVPPRLVNHPTNKNRIEWSKKGWTKKKKKRITLVSNVNELLSRDVRKWKFVVLLFLKKI